MSSSESIRCIRLEYTHNICILSAAHNIKMINVNFLSASREEIVAGNDLSKPIADTHTLSL